MNMEEKQENKLKASILERIEAESPTPKMVFLTREYIVWSLWALSAVIGAVAIAVMLFVGTHQQYVLYEATHENLYTFMIEVLPYLWFGAFALMTGLAVYNLHHTKRGYKYPVWQIVTSSLVLSFVGGAALQLFGFGYSVDHELGERLNAYRSQEQREMLLWQQPEQGRMVGVLRVDHEFIDNLGQEWKINTTSLLPHEMDLLNTSKPVRLLGTTSDDVFIVCGVFPAMEPTGPALSELKQQRDKFRQKAEHLERLAFEKDSTANPCQKLPVQQRMLKNR